MCKKARKGVPNRAAIRDVLSLPPAFITNLNAVLKSNAGVHAWRPATTYRTVSSRFRTTSARIGSAALSTS